MLKVGWGREREMRIPLTRAVLRQINSNRHSLLRFRPSRNRCVLLPLRGSNRVRKAARRVLVDLEIVEPYLSHVSPAPPSCKLFGVGKVLRMGDVDDRNFIYRIVLLLAVRLYSERDDANQSTAMYAAKCVHYASDVRFLTRVLAPAGYVTCAEYSRANILRGDEAGRVFFGVNNSFYVSQWFISNASLGDVGDLTALMRELEMEE